MTTRIDAFTYVQQSRSWLLFKPPMSTLLDINLNVYMYPSYCRPTLNSIELIRHALVVQSSPMELSLFFPPCHEMIDQDEGVSRGNGVAVF